MEKRDNSWISGRQSSGSHMPSRLPMDPLRKSSPLAPRFTRRIILVYISLRFIMNGVSCYHQHPSSLVQMLLTLMFPRFPFKTSGGQVFFMSQLSQHHRAIFLRGWPLRRHLSPLCRICHVPQGGRHGVRLVQRPRAPSRMF